MTTLNPQSALSLIESIIKQSQAEGVFVTLRQNESTLSRFSENQISQNLSKNNFKVTVT
ncbi:MAG: TldD/PmbA family protein, partial [Cyanobacteria bacterium J083]